MQLPSIGRGSLSETFHFQINRLLRQRPHLIFYLCLYFTQHVHRPIVGIFAWRSSGRCGVRECFSIGSARDRGLERIQHGMNAGDTFQHVAPVVQKGLQLFNGILVCQLDWTRSQEFVIFPRPRLNA